MISVTSSGTEIQQQVRRQSETDSTNGRSHLLGAKQEPRIGFKFQPKPSHTTAESRSMVLRILSTLWHFWLGCFRRGIAYTETLNSAATLRLLWFLRSALMYHWQQQQELSTSRASDLLVTLLLAFLRRVMLRNHPSS